ncbi:MAG TPA: Uma2 family endonuclease [Chitinophagaceae bacterium]|jgi:Uma2 family endonuclease|nr:Uma2 family endonuclease [Chitinophagaceae bacterium]
MENEVKEPAAKFNFVSPEDYLAIERASEEKHEYFKGEVFAMSGASREHNIISKNLNTVVLPFLAGKDCNMFGSDLRIHIPENSLFTYPDFLIICGDWITTDNEKDTVTNPSVIVEILSRTTRDYDRGTKFNLYRSIKMLKEYILIDSLNVSVEIFTRQNNDKWVLSECKYRSESFMISTIGMTIRLSDVYEGILLDE